MKCRYKYCKNNNEVDKAIAIKVGSAYYCPECNDEKNLKAEIEVLLRDNYNFMVSVVRSVIAKLIHEQGLQAEYVLFVTKHIVDNNKTIRNPYGLLYYCVADDMKQLYKDEKITSEFKDMKNDLLDNENIDTKEVKFKYVPSKPTWHIL